MNQLQAWKEEQDQVDPAYKSAMTMMENGSYLDSKLSSHLPEYMSGSSDSEVISSDGLGRAEQTITSRSGVLIVKKPLPVKHHVREGQSSSFDELNDYSSHDSNSVDESSQVKININLRKGRRRVFSEQRYITNRLIFEKSIELPIDGPQFKSRKVIQLGRAQSEGRGRSMMVDTETHSAVDYKEADSQRLVFSKAIGTKTSDKSFESEMEIRGTTEKPKAKFVDQEAQYDLVSETNRGDLIEVTQERTHVFSVAPTYDIEKVDFYSQSRIENVAEKRGSTMEGGCQTNDTKWAQVEIQVDMPKEVSLIEVSQEQTTVHSVQPNLNISTIQTELEEPIRAEKYKITDASNYYAEKKTSGSCQTIQIAEEEIVVQDQSCQAKVAMVTEILQTAVVTCAQIATQVKKREVFCAEQAAQCEILSESSLIDQVEHTCQTEFIDWAQATTQTKIDEVKKTDQNVQCDLKIETNLIEISQERTAVYSSVQEVEKSDLHLQSNQYETVEKYDQFIPAKSSVTIQTEAEYKSKITEDNSQTVQIEWAQIEIQTKSDVEFIKLMDQSSHWDTREVSREPSYICSVQTEEVGLVDVSVGVKSSQLVDASHYFSTSLASLEISTQYCVDLREGNMQTENIELVQVSTQVQIDESEAKKIELREIFKTQTEEIRSGVVDMCSYYSRTEAPKSLQTIQLSAMTLQATQSYVEEEEIVVVDKTIQCQLDQSQTISAIDTVDLIEVSQMEKTVHSMPSVNKFGTTDYYSRTHVENNEDAQLMVRSSYMTSVGACQTLSTQCDLSELQTSSEEVIMEVVDQSCQYDIENASTAHFAQIQSVGWVENEEMYEVEMMECTSQTEMTQWRQIETQMTLEKESIELTDKSSQWDTRLVEICRDSIAIQTKEVEKIKLVDANTHYKMSPVTFDNSCQYQFKLEVKTLQTETVEWSQVATQVEMYEDQSHTNLIEVSQTQATVYSTPTMKQSQQDSSSQTKIELNVGISQTREIEWEDLATQAGMSASEVIEESDQCNIAEISKDRGIIATQTEDEVGCRLVNANVSFSKLLSTYCQQTIQSNELRSVEIQTAAQTKTISSENSCQYEIGIRIGVSQTSVTQMFEASTQVHVDIQTAAKARIKTSENFCQYEIELGICASQTGETEMSEASTQVHVAQSETIYEQNLIEVSQEQTTVHSTPSTNIEKSLSDAFNQTEQSALIDASVATGRYRIVDASDSFSKSSSTHCQKSVQSSELRSVEIQTAAQTKTITSENCCQYEIELGIGVSQTSATQMSEASTQVNVDIQTAAQTKTISSENSCQYEIGMGIGVSQTSVTQMSEASTQVHVDIQTAAQTKTISSENSCQYEIGMGIGVSQTSVTQMSEASTQVHVDIQTAAQTKTISSENSCQYEIGMGIGVSQTSVTQMSEASSQVHVDIQTAAKAEIKTNKNFCQYGIELGIGVSQTGVTGMSEASTRVHVAKSEEICELDLIEVSQEQTTVRSTPFTNNEKSWSDAFNQTEQSAVIDALVATGGHQIVDASDSFSKSLSTHWQQTVQSSELRSAEIQTAAKAEMKTNENCCQYEIGLGIGVSQIGVTQMSEASTQVHVDIQTAAKAEIKTSDNCCQYEIGMGTGVSQTSVTQMSEASSQVHVDIQTAAKAEIKTSKNFCQYGIELGIGVSQTGVTGMSEASTQVHVAKSEEICEQNLVEVSQEQTTVHSIPFTNIEKSWSDAFNQTEQSASIETSVATCGIQLVDARISFSKLLSSHGQQTIQSSESRSMEIQTAAKAETTLTEWVEASEQVHVAKSETINEQNLIEVSQEQTTVHSTPSTNFLKPLFDAFIQTEQTD
ncbi:hypothetical protein Ciccas_009915, partial [Cichlidogyrus casuarinus]